ncbi:MAG: hypothetical protein NC337_14470 [Roseburia sp.]|nr:hypothetical protein [Roseburia sp.]
MKDDDYNIDTEEDISHIFFFAGERNIASPETVDYENYIVMEAPVSREDKLLCSGELISENIRACVKGKSDIEDLVQGEAWKPAGA